MLLCAGEEMTQQTAAPTDAQVLAAEFPQFAADVIEVMLEDQGGDAAEVRFQLRVRCLSETWRRLVSGAVFGVVRITLCLPDLVPWLARPMECIA